MTIFNNREIALALWFLIAFSFCLSNKSIRSALKSLFTALFQRLVIMNFFVMMSYIGFIVFILLKIGLWDLGLLKNTVYWTFSVGAATLFRVSKISEDKSYFSDAIRDNVKIDVAIEFVAVFYTFSFLTEFVILPVTTFIVLMVSFSENKEEYFVVEKLFTRVLVIFGLFLLAHAIFRIVSDPQDFFSLQTLKDFYLPPLLSILFLPYVFAMGVYVSYENSFTRLKLTIKNDQLRAYAKRKAVFSFRTDITTLKRWSLSLFSSQIETKDDVLSTIERLREIQAREANPEKIPFEQGWSPYRAKDFLAEVGLPTGFYRKVTDGLDEWWADSSYLNLGQGLFPNRISYYIGGNERAATSLKLVLDVNESKDAKIALEKLSEVAGVLFKKAFHKECPKNIEASLLAGRENEVIFQTKVVKTTREDWSTENGYTMKLVVKNKDETSLLGD